MIEFAPKLGEDALIGRAPVRPRGRSSSSSINNHSISSKQQRSSSITNSPDPSIITSDAAEPTAAGSRGANCVVMAEPVTRRPPRRTRTWDRGHRSAQRGAPATRRRLSVTRRPFRGSQPRVSPGVSPLEHCRFCHKPTILAKYATLECAPSSPS